MGDLFRASPNDIEDTLISFQSLMQQITNDERYKMQARNQLHKVEKSMQLAENYLEKERNRNEKSKAKLVENDTKHKM